MCIRDMLPPQEMPSPAHFAARVPLSPKLDSVNTYASPASLLPRRSRGAEFSSCLLYTSPSPRHLRISYAVFCLKKKQDIKRTTQPHIVNKHTRNTNINKDK